MNHETWTLVDGVLRDVERTVEMRRDGDELVVEIFGICGGEEEHDVLLTERVPLELVRALLSDDAEALKAAYDAGFNNGRDGPNPVNCSFRHFATGELMHAWQRGAAAGAIDNVCFKPGCERPTQHKGKCGPLREGSQS